MEDLRKKDLITYYRYKRTFLLVDEWGFYTLLLFLYFYNVSYLLIASILLYGGTGIYTSYKNLEKLEKYLVSIDQETYLYRDVYELGLELSKSIQNYFSQSRIPVIMRKPVVEQHVNPEQTVERSSEIAK